MIKDERIRYTKFPVRVVMTRGSVTNEEALCKERALQPSLSFSDCCVLQNKGGEHAAVLLDFGREMHGYPRLISQAVQNEGRRCGLGDNLRGYAAIRVSCGESASEAVTPIGVKNASNDHSLRDVVLDVSNFASAYGGETAFRFVYLELLDDAARVDLRCAVAVAVERDLPLLGSFRSDDERLNRIWETAVHTVHLNMQDYLWDGCKRDRLVWVGDMHTEILTILAAYGDVSLIEKNYDYMMAETGDGFMNNMFTYSMWWVMGRYDLYLHTGDLETLKRHRDYLVKMLNIFCDCPESRMQTADRWLFLDWPTQADGDVTRAGVYGMLVITLAEGAALCRALGDDALAGKCEARAAEMKKFLPDYHGNKEAAAILALAGVLPAETAHDVIAKDGAHGYSTFLGYYLLRALTLTGDTEAALSAIRTYWGGMLDMGATSFWEDFNLDWMKNACPIDRLPLPGEEDVHGDFGGYCYVGLRHSLCHGWASGPCPFLSRFVLGIEPAAPGFAEVRITPHLGDLRFAEGTYPTPRGEIFVRHEKAKDGSVVTTVKVPDGVRYTLG